MKRNLIFSVLLLLPAVLTFAADNPVNIPSWRETYFAGEPLNIGNRVQFLFDDYLVEDKYGLDRIVGPVEKFAGNPLVIGVTMPWEAATASFDGANLRHIIFDPHEQIFKGWYVTYRVEAARRGNGTNYNYDTLYAESKDGIHWEKPLLDLFPFDDKPTNTVLHQDQETALLEEIMLDPHAQDPATRYTALVKTVPPGETIRCIVRMHSPDGKQWALPENPILFRGASDGAYSLVHDQDRARWLLFRRPPTRALENDSDPFYGDRNNKRRFSVSMSHDMRTWTYPRGIVMMDELDDRRLEQIGNRMDIDWVTAIAHEGLFLSFASLLDNLKISVPGHVHLAWSRDGLDWERLPNRPTFIPNGGPSDWDANSIAVNTVIPHGDRFHLYYSGSNTTQSFYGREGETNIPRFSGTGLAFIGKNRFIGLQAGPEGGYLLTRQFLLEGNRLEVNIRPNVGNPPPGQRAEITAELLRPAEDHFSAEPYSGYSLGESDLLPVNDSFSHALSWQGSADLSALRGKSVFVRFHLRNATFYTITIVDAD